MGKAFIIANAIFAVGNFYFAGANTDMVNLGIGIGNLFCVILGVAYD